MVIGVVAPEYCQGGYKIGVYATNITNQNDWTIQPSNERPDTRIKEDCSWNTQTHSWLVLAVFLVPIDFDFPPDSDTPGCPPLLTQEIRLDIVSYLCKEK
jgi:hypothetical protein